MKLPAAAAVLAIATPVAAQPFDLTVDPAQSTLDLTIDLVTALGTLSDNDSSPIEGFLTVELSPSPAFDSLTLSNYEFAAQDTLEFFFNAGIGGSLSLTAADTGIRQPSGSAATTGTIDAMGAVSLVGVPSEAFGMVDGTGTGVIGTIAGPIMLDLSTVTTDPASVTGTITIEGDAVTLTASVPFDLTSEVVEGQVTANIAGTATVVATGTLPAEPDCVADTNGDGMLSPADFNGWIIAFNSQAPECDQNGDGLCTPADFNGWIINFNAGC